MSLTVFLFWAGMASAASPAGEHRWGPWPAPGEITAEEGSGVGSEERHASGPQLVFLGLIRGYQMTLSGKTGGHCNFYPSCSRFGYECIHTYGMLGIPLVADRLLRCQPGARADGAYEGLVNGRIYDPVAGHAPLGLADPEHNRDLDRERVRLYRLGVLVPWLPWR